MNNIKLKGRVPKHFNPLLIDYISYCLDQLNITDNIIINFKTTKKEELGFINFSKITVGNYEIIIDADVNYDYILKYIAHELTHVKQISNGKLYIDNNHFLWDNNEIISIRDYNKIAENYDYEEYKSLPWEREAYYNQNELYNKYIKSIRLENFTKTIKEPNLLFIINNILI